MTDGFITILYSRWLSCCVAVLMQVMAGPAAFSSPDQLFVCKFLQ